MTEFKYSKHLCPVHSEFTRRALGTGRRITPAALQDFYLKNDIIRKKLKAADVFTNQFVK